MLVFLARHGNTFQPNEKSVFVGTQDLELTEEGIKQAEKLGQGLKDFGVEIRACYTSQLRRTVKFGEIITEKLAYRGQIEKDFRLNEIDYGTWSGLTREEVLNRYPEELSLFESQLIYPRTFHPKREEIQLEISSFLGMLSEQSLSPVFVVSSQAKLRFFLEMDSIAWEKALIEKKMKMAPGHLSAFSYENGAFQVLFWNQTPEELSQLSFFKNQNWTVR